MSNKLFNWRNFRLLKELVLMHSNQDSLLSKKRIESSIAFWFALVMTVFYLYKKIDTMDIWDFGYVLATWLFVGGYTVSMIQKEKKAEIKADQELTDKILEQK